MGLSWTKVRLKYKTPLRVVFRCLWQRLQRRSRKCHHFKLQRDEARQEVARQEVELARQREQLRVLQDRLRKSESKNQALAAASCRLPDDPPLESHKYGLRMMGLAINLARVVGLRPSERALRIFWQWLGIEQPLPNWTTIRLWLMRLGVAALEEPLERADDQVWMVDHSNQIGPEKVLVVLGVRASQLPPPGETLGHEDVRVLMVQPGTHWKREDMAAVYDQLAKRCGPPRAVLCDGAVELREGVKPLEKRGLRHDRGAGLQAQSGLISEVAIGNVSAIRRMYHRDRQNASGDPADRNVALDAAESEAQGAIYESWPDARVGIGRFLAARPPGGGIASRDRPRTPGGKAWLAAVLRLRVGGMACVPTGGGYRACDSSTSKDCFVAPPSDCKWSSSRLRRARRANAWPTDSLTSWQQPRRSFGRASVSR